MALPRPTWLAQQCTCEPTQPRHFRILLFRRQLVIWIVTSEIRAHRGMLQGSTFLAGGNRHSYFNRAPDNTTGRGKQLAEVIEEWILVRVARGLAIPPMGEIEISVEKAS
ncbi:MAG: hypothetical protein MJD61_15610 [Proteobacteria bacterium]|nr:hypothetical protein [Pseudomonadota bacterium]